MNSTKIILESMGFKVDLWLMPLEGVDTEMLQVTNPTGITFYIRSDSSIHQAIDRYREKVESFYNNTTKG